MPVETTKVSVVGCGNIAWAYLTAKDRFDILDIVACADVNMEAAKAKATEYSILKVLTVEKLLADPDVQIVVNLTPPATHAKIALAALQAGKPVALWEHRDSAWKDVAQGIRLVVQQLRNQRAGRASA